MPTLSPMFPLAPQPPQFFYVPNQQPPIGYKMFAQPPQHLERVNYNARLLEGFNATYQNHQHHRRSYRISTYSSTAQSVNAQAGPAYPPAILQPFLNPVIPSPVQGLLTFNMQRISKLLYNYSTYKGSKQSMKDNCHYNSKLYINNRRNIKDELNHINKHWNIKGGSSNSMHYINRH